MFAENTIFKCLLFCLISTVMFSVVGQAENIRNTVNGLKTGDLDPQRYDFGTLRFQRGAAGEAILSQLHGWAEDRWNTLEEEARAALPKNGRFSPHLPELCNRGWRAYVIMQASKAVLTADTESAWTETYARGQKLLQLAESEVDKRLTAVAESEFDTELARFLNRILARQQAFSAPLLFRQMAGVSNHARAYFNAILYRDNCRMENNIVGLLHSIFNTEGWPIRSKHGKSGDYAAFMLLHNTSTDMELLRNGLSLLKLHYKSGETSPTYYANLFDIVAFYEGRKQRYGMILRCQDGVYAPVVPIEDRETVEDRRRKMGLPSLESVIEENSRYCE